MTKTPIPQRLPEFNPYLGRWVTPGCGHEGQSIDVNGQNPVSTLVRWAAQKADVTYVPEVAAATLGSDPAQLFHV